MSGETKISKTTPCKVEWPARSGGGRTRCRLRNPFADRLLNPLTSLYAAPIMNDHVKKPASPAQTCPICGKPQSQATRPFCSSRCRDVDLNRWLKGSCVIPGRDDETDGIE